jgi:hypothetical protein
MTMVEEYMRDAIINSIIHDEAFMYFLMLLVAVLIFTVYITIEELMFSHYPNLGDDGLKIFYRKAEQ